jgi:hypothetical protein
VLVRYLYISKIGITDLDCSLPSFEGLKDILVLLHDNLYGIGLNPKFRIS